MNLISKENIYLKPDTLESALSYASQYKNSFKYVAGGTDIFANRFQGNESSSCFIDISGIKELTKCEVIDRYFRIGSLTTLNELISNQYIKNEFPVLVVAAKSVASPLIRYRATIGGNLLCENRCYYYNQSDWWKDSAGHCLKCEGNICIATGSKKACYSEFISDTAPALISLDAEIEIYKSGVGYPKTKPAAQKRLKLEDIYSGEGVNPLRLNSSDIITSVYIPADMEYKSVFKKLRHRASLEFTSLSSAVTINKNKKLKVVLAGVDSGPLVF